MNVLNVVDNRNGKVRHVDIVDIVDDVVIVVAHVMVVTD